MDLTNKVILDVEDYVKLITELAILKENKDRKYNELIKYLFSECNVKKYSNGKHYIDYDGYNNHLGDYLEEIEPEKYQQKIDKYKEGQE